MLLSENVYSVSVWRYRIFKSSQTDLENRKLNIYILIIIIIVKTLLEKKT